MPSTELIFGNSIEFNLSGWKVVKETKLKFVVTVTD